jgi:hypothetical protein
MEFRLPTDVKEQFDLVGFDPRGVGASTPITCGLAGDELNVLHSYKPETFAQDVARARTVADKCARSGPTVADIEDLQAGWGGRGHHGGFGSDQVSAVKHGRGDGVGDVQADLEPGGDTGHPATGRRVVDGDPDRAFGNQQQVEEISGRGVGQFQLGLTQAQRGDPHLLIGL